MQNPVEGRNFLAMLPEISLPPEQKQNGWKRGRGQLWAEQPQKGFMEDRRPCSNLHPALEKDGWQPTLGIRYRGYFLMPKAKNADTMSLFFVMIISMKPTAARRAESTGTPFASKTRRSRPRSPG